MAEAAVEFAQDFSGQTGDFSVAVYKLFGFGVWEVGTKTGLVLEVQAFPGHIACDAASRLEIVLPLVKDGRLWGLLDLDSPLPGRFGAADQAGLEALAAVFLAATELHLTCQRE